MKASTPRIFGVTGGVGMGKSAVAEMLRRHDMAIVDTDALARQLTEPGQPALSRISERFGPGALNADASLNRQELARIVFNDEKARADLEAILHPAIRALWEADVARWRADGRTRGAVIIPLLFENGSESSFDAVICVACSQPTQEIRLRERGWPAEQIDGRISAQLPIEQKLTRSDFVVWTDTALDVTEAQVVRIIDNAGRRQKTRVCA
jgi:dephospho-CoA kinase